MDHFWPVHLCSVIDLWMCVDLHRSCKLWSFSTYPLPDFLFSHVLDVMELLIMKPCPKPVPCSPSSNTLPDLCQPHLEPYFRGAVLLLNDTPRCGSIAFHSSFPPLYFSLHFSLSFCPTIPRFWEFRTYTHCSVSLSHTSFTESSWEDPLFSHSVGDPLFSHHGSGHSQPHVTNVYCLGNFSIQVSWTLPSVVGAWDCHVTCMQRPSIHNFKKKLEETGPTLQ